MQLPYSVESIGRNVREIVYKKDDAIFPVYDAQRIAYIASTIEAKKQSLGKVIPVFLGIAAYFSCISYAQKGYVCVFVVTEMLHPLLRSTLEALGVRLCEWDTFATNWSDTVLQENEHYSFDIVDNTAVDFAGTQIQEIRKRLAILLYKALGEENNTYFLPILPVCYRGFGYDGYKILYKILMDINKDNPFARTQYTKMTSQKNVKILCIWPQSDIAHDVAEALHDMGIEHRVLLVQRTMAGDAYIGTLLHTIATFQPSFIITINNVAFDNKGVVSQIIEQSQLPIASWFMDSPEGDIEEAVGIPKALTSVFCYDAAHIPYLHERGFVNAQYLPVGTSVKHFLHNEPQQKEGIVFVGSSHESSIQAYKNYAFTEPLHKANKELVEDFLQSSAYTVEELLEEYPVLYSEYKTLSRAMQREFSQYIISQGTQRKRLETLITCAEWGVTLYGDQGWNDHILRYPYITYKGSVAYKAVQSVYRAASIVLNSTCTQMKQAVNQRVFDVPLTGSFIITEDAQQLQQLFEVEKEIITYRSFAECKEHIAFFKKHTTLAEDIILAAKKRICNEHTWQCRLYSLIESMRNTYGTPKNQST